MKHREFVAPLFLLAAVALVANRACAQETGVRLGLSYPRGTNPTVVVMPADSAPGDSVRTILERDFDFSDRIRPLVLDIVTLQGLTPRRPGEYNYALFAKFGAAAIIQPVRTATGFRVGLYDVNAKKLLQTGEFVVPRVPRVRTAELRDSLKRVLTADDAAARDSARSVYLDEARAKRPVNPKDKRNRRFIVRDSIARDSTIRAEVRSRLSEFDEARAEAVRTTMEPIMRDLTFRDSMARVVGQVNNRMALHGIADEVERWITGKRGIAQTRIAYVHDGKIRVVDSDGANDVAITRSGLSLSPAWSPDAVSLVYSTLSDRGSQIAMTNLQTGQASVLGSAAMGLNITPVFTPDGRGIVYATGNDQGTNIVRADSATGSVTSLTVANNRGDNASPSFSPDGRRIAFLSSRARYPEIYAMDADGSNVELVTPYNPAVRTYRTAPDWSPDGRSIAFEQQNGDFQVWVVNLRDKEMRRLTSEGENEGPSWAPDARHIAISSTRSGSKQIWILDTQSGRFRQLTKNPGARLAAWSPLIRVAP
jgi:tol-pal system beta propeller repeat protein TolB